MNELNEIRTVNAVLVAPALIFSNEPRPRRLLETRRLIFQTNFVTLPDTHTKLLTPYLFKEKYCHHGCTIELMPIRTTFVELTVNCGHQ